MIQTPPDTSGAHVWLVLMKAHRAMDTLAASSLATTGLNPSDFRVLEVLLHKGPLPVNTIGDKVHLTTGAITMAVDRLAAKGHVTRQADPQDRRVRHVALTAKGRRLITRIFQQHAAILDQAASTLTTKQRATLIALLKQLGTSAEALSR